MWPSYSNLPFDGEVVVVPMACLPVSHELPATTPNSTIFPLAFEVPRYIKNIFYPSTIIIHWNTIIIVVVNYLQISEYWADWLEEYAL